LQDSALYFGFACERAVVEAALLAAARAFVDAKPRKVRLLVARDGSLEIAAESLLRKAGTQEVGRVSIATERTDSLDRMLFHKTTHRPLYAQAFSAASVAGLDDVLFLNERGEVTEGAISNIFIEKDGRWFTPPVECGLLAGVYRRHLLETRQGIEERVLYSEDLRLADAVYLANAVRGLRKVAIDWESQTSCRQPPIPDP
jgi:para-aminobenzoate synthetase/4-amino-4-deoxychorismate lyase